MRLYLPCPKSVEISFVQDLSLSDSMYDKALTACSIGCTEIKLVHTFGEVCDRDGKDGSFDKGGFGVGIYPLSLKGKNLDMDLFCTVPWSDIQPIT